ncbi:MAG: hypothetical protein PEGG_01710 [Paraeggerthella hongkongensis]|mgnify:CR=1 FL=1|jgi:hypothetical protein|uniref:DUF4860 domain-containing protein n=1 Tax=Paraeggerthella sp. LCP19S3_G8 TaxID=3440248 RepID=UPI0030E3FABB
MNGNHNIAQALVQATHPGQAASRPSQSRDRVFITILFAVLSLFLLISLLVGTNAYKSINAVRTASDETRLGLSLIGNSIRANDATDAVGVAEGPEGSALVLTERLESGVYETRLYAYQGSIVEEYARADAAFTPEKAREIVKSKRFDFAYENGLLTVYTDQGSTSVALRSVRGGS